MLWLALLFEIFRDDNIGALTFLMMVCGAHIQIFELGHLTDSKLMISSIGTAIKMNLGATYKQM